MHEGDTQISLGKGNKRDFLSGLWAVVDGNMSEQVGAGVEGETTGDRECLSGSSKNLA